MNTQARIVRLLFVGAALLGVEAACAVSPDAVVDKPGMFGRAQAAPTACVETKCPAPFATCEWSEQGLCTTNLNNDIDHCGACDSPCPQPPEKRHESSLCAG